MPVPNQTIVGVEYAAMPTLAPEYVAPAYTQKVINHLFISNNLGPGSTLGDENDWFFQLGEGTMAIYQKSPNWNLYATLAGANLQPNPLDVQSQIGNVLQTTLNLFNQSQNSTTEAVNQFSNSLYAVNTSLNAVGTSVAIEADERVNGDYALATLVQSVSAEFGNSVAQINLQMGVLAEINYAYAYEINSLYAGVGYNSASVVAEASARATADGFLSANYSLVVTAGNVVTSMQLNSSSGGGVTQSIIAFTANTFQIWDGSSTAYPVFNVSTGVVTLANTLNVNISGKVFIGTGTYDNSNTPFYIDNTGLFSLGSSLTFNSGALSISGTVTSTAGTIGGFTIGATSLSNPGGGCSITIGASVSRVQLTGGGLQFGVTGTVGGIFDANGCSAVNAAGDILFQLDDTFGYGTFTVNNSSGVSGVLLNGSTGAITTTGPLIVGTTIGASGTCTLANTGTNFVYANTLRLRGSDSFQIYESATSTNLNIATLGGTINMCPNTTTVAAFETTGLVMTVGMTVQLGNAYVSGALTATGYVTLMDDSGTTYKVLCHT